MFPYYIPAGIGVLCTGLSLLALRHSDAYRRRWPWVGALVAALLLWVPALALFVVVPSLWPQATNGESNAYYQLMSWQVLWIVLGVPPGFIAVLTFMGVGKRSYEVR